MSFQLLFTLVVLVSKVWSKPQNSNFAAFASQSPHDLSQTLHYLENPFLASTLVNQNNRRTNQEELNRNPFLNYFQPPVTVAPIEEENTELLNFFIQNHNRKPMTTAQLDELLENPFFLTFFNDYQDEYEKTQTTSTTSTTTTTAPRTPKVQVIRTRRPQRISTKAPFVPQAFPSTTTEEPYKNNVFLSSKTNMEFTSRIAATRPTSTTAPRLLSALPRLLRASSTTPRVPTTAGGNSEVEDLQKQAENAQYEFSSNVDDKINGNLHQREEVRDGLNVKGKYSYSDGFFKRTVQYEADDKGYRVVHEEVEAIGDGPQFNPEGHARVSQYVAGNSLNYEITKDDIRDKEQRLQRTV